MQELGLRNNQITRIDRAFPKSLTKLDLYDNLIHRIQNLDDLENVTSLDLSYNKIKHIKGVKHLKKLKELFFVQNPFPNSDGLDLFSYGNETGGLAFSSLAVYIDFTLDAQGKHEAAAA